MKVLSDKIILEDLKQMATRIESKCQNYEEEKAELFGRLRTEFGNNKSWHEWKEFLDIKISALLQRENSSDFLIKKYVTYRQELEELGHTMTSGRFYRLDTVSARLLKLFTSQTPDMQSFRGILANKGLFSTFYRLLGIFKEIYDYRQFNFTLDLFKSYSEGVSPPEEFPLLTFLVAFYPDIFFTGQGSFDVIDFAANINDQDHREEITSYAHFLNKLFQYIDAFAMYHPFLYLTSKYYRDHLFHSIRVMWLMGHLFEKWGNLYLRSAQQRLNELLQACGTSSSGALSDKTFKIISLSDYAPTKLIGKQNSMIAGLFHDHFYPISSLLQEAPKKEACSVFNQSQKLGKIIVPSLESPFLKAGLKVVLGDPSGIEACYRSQRPNPEYTQAFQERPFDHGVLAGERLEVFLLEARQAMALHNLDEVEINLTENPIAFFLVLCDEAQEWGRWLTSDGEQRYFIPCGEIEWELSEQDFRIKIDFSKKAKEIKSHKNDFDFKKLLFDKFISLRRLKIPENFKQTFKQTLMIEFLLVDLEKREWNISLSDPSYDWKLKGPNGEEICDGARYKLSWFYWRSSFRQKFLKAIVGSENLSRSPLCQYR